MFLGLTGIPLIRCGWVIYSYRKAFWTECVLTYSDVTFPHQSSNKLTYTFIFMLFKNKPENGLPPFGDNQILFQWLLKAIPRRNTNNLNRESWAEQATAVQNIIHRKHLTVAFLMIHSPDSDGRGNQAWEQCVFAIKERGARAHFLWWPWKR